MTRIGLILLLLLALAGSVTAKEKKASFRAHTMANANDSSSFAAPVVSRADGRTIFITKTAVISERDVETFRPYQAGDGSFGVLLQLDRHGRLALDTLSVERRGTPLVIYVNGRQVAQLQIDQRVQDGRLYLENGLTAADIELMRKTWPLIGQRKK